MFWIVSSAMLSAYFGLNALAYPLIILVALVLKKPTYKIPLSGLIFFGLAILIYTFKSFEPNAIVLIRYLQVYFGFIIFYIVFSQWVGKIDIDKLSVILCTFVFFDALLINILPEGIYLPNYPNFDGPMLDGHSTNYFGFYQRPNGFCANASMTSTVLAAIYTITKTRMVKILLSFSVLILASTTGLALLIVAALLTSQHKVTSALVLGCLIGSVYLLSLVTDEYFIARLSPWYFLMIFEYTFEQYADQLRPVAYSALLGSNYLLDGMPMYNTDNGYAPFYYTNGIILTLAYLSVMFWKRAQQQRIPLLILLLGAFHYPAVFTVPGQIFFALLLLDKFQVCAFLQAKRERTGAQEFGKSNKWKTQFLAS
ncbi:hypothetical protein OAD22_00095 [Pseudomonadales bacterium]|nr:hypothetical protein [Pseudomonadales bacterium]